jgi:hypothetical protein
VRSNDGGQIVANTECTSRGVNLTETQTGAVYDSCSYNWAQGGFGGWSSGCSTTAMRTQSVWCRRDVDGAAVADSFCNASTRPASSETSAQYGSCSYSAGGSVSAWSGWSSTCSGSATRTRTYQCVRSNDGGQIVANSECTSRGVNLSETETSAVYSGCSYNWAQGGWSGWSSGCSNTATRTQSVWCRRDVDGATVADSNCNAGTRPPSSETSGQYGSCTYAAGGSVSAWSGWASGCSSNTTRTRTYQCIRSNDGGQVVASTECTGRGINLTETQSGANYASCSYRIEDAGLGACQTNNTAPHYWRCIRNETGEQVDSATYCGRSNPTYDSCSYPWGYTASYGGWSACNSGSQSRTMTQCQRSDGASVASSYCNSAGYPSTQTQTCTAPVACAVTDTRPYGEMSNYTTFSNGCKGYGDFSCYTITSQPQRYARAALTLRYGGTDTPLSSGIVGYNASGYPTSRSASTSLGGVTYTLTTSIVSSGGVITSQVTTSNGSTLAICK